MQFDDFKALLTPTGQKAIQAASSLAPQEKDFLQHLQRLEKTYPRPLARAALETAVYRLEAVGKFPAEVAQRLYFTREALEQTTSWEVAAYRSRRYRGFDTIFDLGCSIGGDALHLAATGTLIGFELDELRLAMARENLTVMGLEAQFVQADLNAPLPLAPRQQQALFFDPARRADHRRARSVEEYQPPLSVLEGWQGKWRAIGVKISPGVDLEELVGLDCEVEFISLRGELKEAVLWFGPLKTASRRATVLPGPFTLLEGDSIPVETAPPGAFLFEPDPAVLRAGLVGTLAAQLGAVQLDETIAYLTGERAVQTPFARCWRILDWMPFHLKKLRAYCRQNRVGHVTVKKRGSPITPEELISGLKLSGTESRVLVLTRFEGQPVVLVCSEADPVSIGENG